MKTFNEVIFEATNYRYSKEHYEMLRECSELELMATYLESQQFLAQREEFFSESVGTSDPSFFMESVGDEGFQGICEKANEKSSNLKARIMRGLLKIYNSFKNLLSKLTRRFESTYKDSSELLKLIKDHAAFTDSEVEQMQNIVAAAKEKAKPFEVRLNQPFRKHLKMSVEHQSPDTATLHNDLAAALSTDVIVADVAGTAKDQEKIGAVSFELLCDIGASIKFSKSGADVFSPANSSLLRGWATAKARGIEIPADGKRISNMVQQLNDVTSNLQMQVQEVQRMVDAISSTVGAIGQAVMDKTKPDNAEQNAQTVNGVYDRVKSVTDTAFESLNMAIQMSLGVTMQVYVGCQKYRSEVVMGLYRMLKNETSRTEEKGKETNGGNSNP